MTTKTLDEDTRTTVTLLQTLRDEVRVQIHLAGMDVRDEWAKLEPVVDEAERAAAHATEATRQALDHAIERLKKLRASLHEQRAGAAQRN